MVYFILCIYIWLYFWNARVRSIIILCLAMRFFCVIRSHYRYNFVIELFEMLLTKQRHIITHNCYSFCFVADDCMSLCLYQVIKAGVETTCKCHGVSGSCTVQTCWRQLLPFHEIGKQLKQRYEGSVKVGSSTNEATGEGEISTGRSQPPQPLPGPNDQIPRTMDLLHIEDSPSFCRPSKYSSGTAGRKCYKDKNCDAICCGRGHNTQSREVTRPCQCQVRWCCYVECKQCTQREEVYTCKG